MSAQPTDALTAEEEQRERRLLAVEAAALDLRRYDLPDGPCWCPTPTPPAAVNSFTHVAVCRALRAALARPAEEERG